MYSIEVSYGPRGICTGHFLHPEWLLMSHLPQYQSQTITRMDLRRRKSKNRRFDPCFWSSRFKHRFKSMFQRLVWGIGHIQGKGEEKESADLRSLIYPQCYSVPVVYWVLWRLYNCLVDFEREKIDLRTCYDEHINARACCFTGSSYAKGSQSVGCFRPSFFTYTSDFVTRLMQITIHCFLDNKIGASRS